MDNTAEVIPINKNADSSSETDIIVLKFADSSIPVFKESRNKEYIRYGKDNNYPEYLTYLLDKSGMHAAIVFGKANYIFGEGFENGNMIVNRLGESLNDISKKAILDIETYAGYKLEVIWGFGGKVVEIYHVDYSTIRVGKNGGYWFKEQWNIKGANGTVMDNNRVEEEFIPAFNPSYPVGTQIYAYNEYRPMTRFYSLPTYIASNNYIEIDIEISKFYLSSIRNGMMPSKMLQFYMGDPGEEKKKALERSFKNKFAGAENAGKFILVFNAGGKDKQIDISDLSASEMDKMFVELNKTSDQKIFSGHRVTSPMLFGIKTEGQLGGNAELYTAYAIFQNTYSKPKATAYSKEAQYLLNYSIFPGIYDLKPTDPIGLQFDLKDVINALPKAFVFGALNVPKEMWGLENIGADNRPTPTTPIAPSTEISAPGAADAVPVNENLKNLSGKQLIHVNRIVRQYKQGKMLEPMAKTLLRGGLGLSEADINAILGIQMAAMSFEEQEENIISMFDSCGDTAEDFEVIRFKKVSFSHDLEAEADETEFIAAFDANVTATENAILELIRKDNKITSDVIATTLGQSKAFVEAKIDALVKKGYLETSSIMDGEDEIVTHSIPEGLDIISAASKAKINPTQISVKYSYAVKPGVGPALIKTSRPFCIKMIGLNRLYSRAEIESISQRLGYSVFDRKGGWWGKNPECRHRWVSNLVVKK